MVVLIDTNVMMNVLTGRQDPFLASSRQIIDLCSRHILNGCVAFHSLPTIWYLLRKVFSDEQTRYLLINASNIMRIVHAEQRQVREALENKSFRDFEDCLQDKCTQSAGAQYIVTCNIKDFRNAETRAVTPTEMLEIYRQSEGQL